MVLFFKSMVWYHSMQSKTKLIYELHGQIIQLHLVYLIGYNCHMKLEQKKVLKHNHWQIYIYIYIVRLINSTSTIPNLIIQKSSHGHSWFFKYAAKWASKFSNLLNHRKKNVNKCAKKSSWNRILKAPVSSLVTWVFESIFMPKNAYSSICYRVSSYS